MNIKEIELQVFSYIVRNELALSVNSELFQNNELKSYIDDFQEKNCKNINEYIGKNKLSVARLNELIDDFTIISQEQYYKMLKKMERHYKKKKIIELVKNDDIENVGDILNQNIEIEKNNISETISEWLNAEKKEYTKTGIETLDNYNSGLAEPEMVVIAARPGFGKTAIAIQLLNNFLKQNKSVFFASLEMSKRQIFERMVSNFCKIFNLKIRQKILNSNEISLIQHYIEILQEKNITINDNTELTIEDLKMYSYGKDIVIIDYIQLLNSRKSFKSEYEKLEYISREVKKMAKQNNQIVICLAQLNRAVEKEKDSSLGSIKGAGGIEQNADIVIFLEKYTHNETDYFNIETDNYSEIIELNVKKYREGQTGQIYMLFEKPFYRFSEIKKEN